MALSSIQCLPRWLRPKQMFERLSHCRVVIHYTSVYLLN